MALVAKPCGQGDVHYWHVGSGEFLTIVLNPKLPNKITNRTSIRLSERLRQVYGMNADRSGYFSQS
jgi:hypothetical protein